MADIDEVLRNALHADAPPVDNAGVLDAIRQRVAAGDVGTTAGAGGPFPGAGHLPAWLGAGALAIAVGGTLGLTGLPGQEADAGPATALGDIRQDVPGLHCPDGQPVVRFRSGDRVYAVSRSADSTWLGVRSPFDRSQVVWVATAEVDPDAGTGSIAGLPEGGCEQADVRADGPRVKAPKAPPVTVPPTPPVVGESPSGEPSGPTEAPSEKPRSPRTSKPAPPPPPPPPPAPVNQAPKVTSLSLTPEQGATPYCNDSAYGVVAMAHVSDDHGVVKVKVSLSGAGSGSHWMTKSGTGWRFTYDAPDAACGNVRFTAIAYDAAGKASAPVSRTITLQNFG